MIVWIAEGAQKPRWWWGSISNFYVSTRAARTAGYGHLCKTQLQNVTIGRVNFKHASRVRCAGGIIAVDVWTACNGWRTWACNKNILKKRDILKVEITITNSITTDGSDAFSVLKCIRYTLPKVLSDAASYSILDFLSSRWKWLTVANVYHSHALKFVHAWHKGVLPELFNYFFQYASNVHNYNTRYAAKRNLHNRNCHKIVELDWLSGRGPICHIIVSITKFSIVIGSPHVYLHVIDARSRGCPIWTFCNWVHTWLTRQLHALSWFLSHCFAQFSTFMQSAKDVFAQKNFLKLGAHHLLKYIFNSKICYRYG